MSEFREFSELVHASFQQMASRADKASRNLYVVGVPGDEVFASYLGAFPEGSNPIFRERTEHDCSCCKIFIRGVANVVDGARNTIWDHAARKAPYPYNEVAAALATRLATAPIVDVFVVEESRFGAQQTRSLGPDGTVERWNHFHTGEIPRRFRPARPDQVRGEYRTTVQVFRRGLEELAPEALETVLSLIDANTLYRGTEHRRAVLGFQKIQQQYRDAEDGELFVWTHASDQAARFRNSVIGTLVQDLSSGMDVERAVRNFETKVAPQNYKRTTAVITPGMVRKAMETIDELGLEPALERRFARIDDISVNDVLWVDNGVKPLMKGGIGGVLMDHVEETRSLDGDDTHAEEIGVEDFVARVLPEATAMELLFKGEHLGHLMSLTAPIHPQPKQLFRWDNDFAWSYAGNIADSIRERVKQAGGKVTDAQLRTSLSWFNYDDLDIHVSGPGGHIYYGHKRGRCGGVLDVDMNAGGRRSREPVENIAWSKAPDGPYGVSVHNYAHRETLDVGFVVEVENRGRLSHFNYPREVRQGQKIQVVTLHLRKGVVERMEVGGSGITTQAVSQEKWGLKTEKFVRVNAVTLSPNHWGHNAVGNKHTFFVLDGAHNDEPCRGIYNEFLHPRLVKHRKVFEVIGDKTRCQPTEGQLSGLGFSSTKPDTVVVKVDNKRLFHVRFAA